MAASAALCAYMTRAAINVALIQEPWMLEEHWLGLGMQAVVSYQIHQRQKQEHA